MVLLPDLILLVDFDLDFVDNVFVVIPLQHILYLKQLNNSLLPTLPFENLKELKTLKVLKVFEKLLLSIFNYLIFN